MKAFWLWGVVALAVLTLGSQFVLLQIAMAGGSGLLFLAVLFAVTVVAYQFAVSVGVWRSARRYSGTKIWPILARIAVAFSFASIAFAAFVCAQLFSQDSHDGSRTSANVSATLSRTPDYPLVGFWKGSCAEDFGLAIEAATEPKTYSVSFCGPGGCFKPGTYRPNTMIAGDPLYRVIDVNTIEVKGHDGFSRYSRCE